MSRWTRCSHKGGREEAGGLSNYWMSAFRSVFRAGLLHGKSALVTGGGSGIGFAIASELLELGCNVVIASRDETRLAAAAERLQSAAAASSAAASAAGNNSNSATTPASCTYMVCNIRHEEEVDRMVADTVRRLGKLDFVCNNGGGQFPSPARAIPPKGWRAVVDTNLNGTFYVCSAAYRHSMEAFGGSIVNIIADVANGFPGMAHTGAARAGVENLTKTLAVEWAAAGVRVNCISPGIIQSHTTNYDNPNFLTSLSRGIPAQRLGTVAEVAATACFLFGPGAAYITGQNLCVHDPSRGGLGHGGGGGVLTAGRPAAVARCAHTSSG